MKWFELAKLLIPVISAVIPGAAPLAPTILKGVSDAQAISTDPAAKKQHVLDLVADGASTASATGKVAIDPAQAQTITNAVFSAVDAVHAVVKANPPQSALPSTPPV